MKKNILTFIALTALATTALFGCGKMDNKYASEEGALPYEGSGYTLYEKTEELSDVETESNYKTDENKKLVYNCSLEVETLEYEKSMASFRELTEKYQGFIEKEKVTDSARDWYYEGYVKSSGTMTSYITVRIPTENYAAFLADLSGTGKVVSKSADVKNITKKYTETQTTIESLKIQEERLLQMMKEAKGITEMLEVESRLTEVQTELAQYKNALASMDSEVEYSTINLTLREVVQYSPDRNPEKTDTFGERLKNTLKRTWSGFTEFLEDALFFLIEALPFLIIFVGLPLLIILLCVKKAKARKNKEKTAEPAAEEKTEIPEEAEK